LQAQKKNFCAETVEKRKSDNKGKSKKRKPREIGLTDDAEALGVLRGKGGDLDKRRGHALQRKKTASPERVQIRRRRRGR